MPLLVVYSMHLQWLGICSYFYSLLALNLEIFISKHAPILQMFLVSMGVDVELYFMRTLRYIFEKWLILGEVGARLQLLTPRPSQSLGFSCAVESHGLWVLKGSSPVWAMMHKSHNGDQNQCKIAGAKESVLSYASYGV